MLTYFMLVGATPYGQKSVHGALRAAATLPIPPASGRRPDAPIPEALEAVLRRAMAYDREGRPASAEAFLEELNASVARVPRQLLERRPTGTVVGVDSPGSGTSHTKPWREMPRWWRPALIGIAGALLLGGVFGAGWRLMRQQGPGEAGSVVPLLVPAPAPDKVHIQLEYSTEKKRWLEAQTAVFAKEHPNVSVELVGRGSLEAADALVSGTDKPTLWSPADSLLLNLAAFDWEAKHGMPLFAAEGREDAPQPLLLTPLVFIIWSDRAAVLEKRGKGRISWGTLHDAAVAQSWSRIGGKAAWGDVKLGHTSPARSNSGLQAVLLMTLEYYRHPAHLTVAQLDDPGYQRWLQELEHGVDHFEPSTGTFVTDLVRYGPSRYDVGVAYESLAIDQVENAQRRWQPLRVVYPSPTIWSDHPIAILQAPWVTPQQRAAAREYIAFLRSRQAQDQALAFGFRPADSSVPVNTRDPGSPFLRLAPAGIRVEIPPAIIPPDGAVVREALRVWSEKVGTR